MPLTVVLIDPFEKTVSSLELKEGRPLLDQFRELIGMNCQQLDTTAVAEHIILWVDNLGLLKGQKQRFWRLKDSAQRVAGRAILTGTDEDGMPISFAVPPEAVARGIEWCEGVYVERIVEELEAEVSPFGPIPRIVRKVLWGGPEPVVEEVPTIEPEVERRVIWIVYNDEEEVDFLAKERVITADGAGGFTGEEKRFESLDEVRAFAKAKDLVFALPSAEDDAAIAATLV